jgi:transcriptional regulator with XRE-family HTH domain
VQLKAARTLLRASQRQVAERIGVSIDTIQRAEADRVGSARTKRQLVGMLQRNGIVFEGGGVRRTRSG